MGNNTKKIAEPLDISAIIETFLESHDINKILH